MSVWLLDQTFVLLHIHILFKLFHMFNTSGSRVSTNILMLIISQIVVPSFLFWYLKELRGVSISCDCNIKPPYTIQEGTAYCFSTVVENIRVFHRMLCNSESLWQTFVFEYYRCVWKLVKDSYREYYSCNECKDMKQWKFFTINEKQHTVIRNLYNERIYNIITGFLELHTF